MSAPLGLKRVAVEPLLGLTPAIAPQPYKRRCALTLYRASAQGVEDAPPPRAASPVARAAPPVEPAVADVPEDRCDASTDAGLPWRLRSELWVFRFTLAFGAQVWGRVPRMFKPSPYRGGVRPLAGHAGVPASGKFESGQKQRFVLADGARMSVLTGPQGAQYVLSQGQGHGGYGKLRVAMDFDGVLYAVKEMRLQPRAKEPANLPGDVRRRHTKVSQADGILEEIAVMAAASRAMSVHACFEVQGKVYLFLPLMADDATTLATGTPDFARVAVGRQLLLQACEDLACIHRRGYIHHDVKLHNILWNGAGAAGLADFGLSCKVDDATGTSRAGGRTFGNMPLEYELGAPSSARLDIFMLGLAMADYLAPGVRTQPATGQTVDQLMALESWRARVRDAAGDVDLARPIDVENLSAAERTWHAYFTRVCTADADMGAFIIARMLAREPEARADLREVRAFVAALQPPGGARARMAVQVMRTIADNDWDRQRLLRHMRYFKRRLRSASGRPSGLFSAGFWHRLRALGTGRRPA